MVRGLSALRRLGHLPLTIVGLKEHRPKLFKLSLIQMISRRLIRRTGGGLPSDRKEKQFGRRSREDKKGPAAKRKHLLGEACTVHILYYNINVCYTIVVI